MTAAKSISANLMSQGDATSRNKLLILWKDRMPTGSLSLDLASKFLLSCAVPVVISRSPYVEFCVKPLNSTPYHGENFIHIMDGSSTPRTVSLKCRPLFPTPLTLFVTNNPRENALLIVHLSSLVARERGLEEGKGSMSMNPNLTNYGRARRIDFVCVKLL